MHKLNQYLFKKAMQGLELQDIQNLLMKKYMSSDLISEYQCIRKQSDMLQSIKSLMEQKKHGEEHSYDFGINNLNIEASSILQVNNCTSDDSLIKSKFTEQFQQSIIESALKDVRANCAEQTFETVRQYIQNNKLKQFESVQKVMKKISQENQDLQSQLLIAKLDKSDIEKKLFTVQKKVESLEDEKERAKKRVNMVMEKEGRLHKLYSSFTFKEKLCIDIKRKYERQKELNAVAQKRISQMTKYMDDLWAFVCSKIEITQCEGNCWRKDVMAKCKQQLVEERKLLKEESAHIEKEYEVMNKTSAYFRQIFYDQLNKVVSTKD